MHSKYLYTKPSCVLSVICFLLLMPVLFFITFPSHPEPTTPPCFLVSHDSHPLLGAPVSDVYRPKLLYMNNMVHQLQLSSTYLALLSIQRDGVLPIEAEHTSTTTPPSPRLILIGGADWLSGWMRCDTTMLTSTD
jgi:hypothetical protein